MAATLPFIAYQLLQDGKGMLGLTHKAVVTRLMTMVAPGGAVTTEPVPMEALAAMQRSSRELLRRDWEDKERGMYPESLLFSDPWATWASRYPQLCLDIPAFWDRRRRGETSAIPPRVDTSGLPAYYLQNFHHQTGGYLSDHSAQIYDLQVEILFNGLASAMRRRVIAPLKKGLERVRDRPLSACRLLDVATGTGSTLEQLTGGFPEAQLLGLDLSGAYLREANRRLSQAAGVLPQLLKGNAEAMPYASGSMQAVTNVFLLHELPGPIRQRVLEECWRVLEPGGTLVLADSVQEKDAAEFQPALANFPIAFHEPYYRDYVRDDIEARLSRAGFVDIQAASYFMARVWSARRPSTGC